MTFTLTYIISLKYNCLLVNAFYQKTYDLLTLDAYGISMMDDVLGKEYLHTRGLSTMLLFVSFGGVNDTYILLAGTAEYLHYYHYRMLADCVKLSL